MPFLKLLPFPKALLFPRLLPFLRPLAFLKTALAFYIFTAFDVEHVADEIVFVQPLHDDDDGAATLIVEPAIEGVVVPVKIAPRPWSFRRSALDNFRRALDLSGATRDISCMPAAARSRRSRTRGAERIRSSSDPHPRAR